MKKITLLISFLFLAFSARAQNTVVVGQGIMPSGSTLPTTCSPTNSADPDSQVLFYHTTSSGGSIGLYVCSATNTWTAAGGGGVTSLTGDGTIITNSASTGAVTLTIAGTSGGIPCFNSANTWQSSIALLANNIIKGGGAGGCPGLSTITDNGTNVSTTEPIITSAAGAASAPAISATGTPFVGTGTTSVPLIYANGGTAPTTWNSSVSGGTYFGINAISGFAGNFLDFHTNGGASLFNVTNQGNINANVITALNTISAGSANNIGFTSRSFFASPSNGVMNVINNAGTGFTRFAFGTDTSAFPAACPITGTTPYLAIDVAGACTTGTFIKTAQTLQVTGSDFSCTTGCTSLATITGLSVALPTVATNWSFSCDLVVSQATAAAADQIGVQTATNAPTNLEASAIAYTAAAVSTAGAIVAVSSTASQSVVTFTPGATGTNMPIHLAGTVEGTSTSGTTLNIQVLTGSSSDQITIRRGSACYVY